MCYARIVAAIAACTIGASVVSAAPVLYITENTPSTYIPVATPTLLNVSASRPVSHTTDYPLNGLGINVLMRRGTSFGKIWNDYQQTAPEDLLPSFDSATGDLRTYHDTNFPDQNPAHEQQFFQDTREATGNFKSSGGFQGTKLKNYTKPPETEAEVSARIVKEYKELARDTFFNDIAKIPLIKKSFQPSFLTPKAIRNFLDWQSVWKDESLKAYTTRMWETFSESLRASQEPPPTSLEKFLDVVHVPTDRFLAEDPRARRLYGESSEQYVIRVAMTFFWEFLGLPVSAYSFLNQEIKKYFNDYKRQHADEVDLAKMVINKCASSLENSINSRIARSQRSNTKTNIPTNLGLLFLDKLDRTDWDDQEYGVRILDTYFWLRPTFAVYPFFYPSLFDDVSLASFVGSQPSKGKSESQFDYARRLIKGYAECIKEVQQSTSYHPETPGSITRTPGMHLRRSGRYRLIGAKSGLECFSSRR